jgi:hypothetical protein
MRSTIREFELEIIRLEREVHSDIAVATASHVRSPLTFAGWL